MRKLFFMLGAAALVASCTNVNEGVNTLNDGVSFTVDGIKSRVAAGQFEQNDVISVDAFENGTAYQSAEYSYTSNGEFTSNDPISYASDVQGSKELSYIAAYPAQEATSFTFTANADQRDAESYEASDLLIAHEAATTSMKPALTFYHTMSNVVVNVVVKRDGAVSANETVGAPTFNAILGATCDLVAKTYTATGASTEINPTVSASGDQYLAVVAPQTIAANTVFATIAVNGKAFEFARTTDMKFVSGYQYIYTWTIDVATGTQTINVEGTIEGWGDGDEDGDDEGPVTPPATDLVNFEMTPTNFPTEASAEVTKFTEGGVNFELANMYYNAQYGSYAIATGSNGYLVNTSAMTGIKQIIVVEDYKYYNLTIYAGTEASNVTTAIEPAKSGNDYVYDVEGYTFFKVANDSEHDAQGDEIKFLFTEEEQGDTNSVEANCTSILAAMGATKADIDADNGLPIVGAEFTNFTLNTDQGTATVPFRLWGDETLRSYKGNTITVTAKNGKKVKSIEMSTSPLTEATVGAVSGKTWTGDADEVTITTDKASNNFITIVVE